MTWGDAFIEKDVKWESKSNSIQFLHYIFVSREGREVGEGWEKNSETPERSTVLRRMVWKIVGGQEFFNREIRERGFRQNEQNGQNDF
jgi:hypothetical protein